MFLNIISRQFYYTLYYTRVRRVRRERHPAKAGTF